MTPGNPKIPAAAREKPLRAMATLVMGLSRFTAASPSAPWNAPMTIPPGRSLRTAMASMVTPQTVKIPTAIQKSTAIPPFDDP